MTPAGFEHMAKMHRITGFRKKLLDLNAQYDEVQFKFNKLCDDLDNCVLNEQNNELYLNEISTHLTIYISELDLIEKRIKEISEIIERLTLELSN